MRYTLLLHSDESMAENFTEADWAEIKTAYGAYIGMLREAGVFVDTDWLQPSNTATTITLKDGGRRVQDGAFASSKEQLGGYFVLNVDDLDAALAWAEKCPAVHTGVIEVRASAM